MEEKTRHSPMLVSPPTAPTLAPLIPPKLSPPKPQKEPVGLIYTAPAFLAFFEAHIDPDGNDRWYPDDQQEKLKEELAKAKTPPRALLRLLNVAADLVEMTEDEFSSDAPLDTARAVLDFIQDRIGGRDSDEHLEDLITYAGEDSMPDGGLRGLGSYHIFCIRLELDHQRKRYQDRIELQKKYDEEYY